MIICPVCNKEFDKESPATKHFLACWKEKNPYHESKSAPRIEKVVSREVSADVADFFSAFQGG